MNFEQPKDDKENVAEATGVTNEQTQENLVEKEKATQEFKEKFKMFDVGLKTGIVSVLGLFNIRGFDDKTLSEAFNKASKDIWKDPQFVGNKKDGRLDRLAWILTDNANQVGNTLTVSEARKICEEEGIHYNPSW